ncbi:hypothetical protein [Streptomyces sp. IBSNAI001]|uniref:hypothetical protein n=1 Tax=Streptomyces sp. IBSNAI001 TaxID=3457499 RepID=UPI003FD2D93F
MVITAAALQALWLGVLITALTIWGLSLSAPVTITAWAGPALGGVPGTWAASKTSPR